VLFLVADALSSTSFTEFASSFFRCFLVDTDVFFSNNARRNSLPFRVRGVRSIQLLLFSTRRPRGGSRGQRDRGRDLPNPSTGFFLSKWFLFPLVLTKHSPQARSRSTLPDSLDDILATGHRCLLELFPLFPFLPPTFSWDSSAQRSRPPSARTSTHLLKATFLPGG